MDKTLRLLMVEDSENDAALLLRELGKQGYKVQYERVENASSLKSALDKQNWDIIISDYVLPSFSGLAALQILEEKNLDIPCIITSGRIDDETAVAAMKAGAKDYIMKDNLKRLGPAIERELREAESRRERQKVQESLNEMSSRLHLITETIQDVFWMSKAGLKEILYISSAFDEVWGRSRQDLLKSPGILTESVYSEDREQLQAALKKHSEGKAYVVEYRILRPDNSIRWIYERGYPVNSNKLDIMAGVSRDVTPQKQAEENLKKVNRAREVLIKVNEALIRSTNETDLLQTVCKICTETGGYRMSWVGYIDENPGKIVHPVAQAGYEEGYLESIQITWEDSENGRGPTGAAIRTGAPCVARDILTDATFLPWRDQAIKRGYASSVSLPLTHNNQTFGVLNIYATETNRFDINELQLLSGLANDLSFGIISLRTQAERDRVLEELRALSNRLVEVQENERRTIARELHDEIGQSLTALKILLAQSERQSGKGSIESLLEAKNIVTELMQQVREMSLKLRPSMLDDLGLLPTLVWHFEKFTTQTGIRIKFDNDGLQDHLMPEINTTAYRVIQEALTNIARYAGVDEACVSTKINNGKLIINIKDTGRGFVPPKPNEIRTSGLSGMRERVRLLNGTLTLDTAPGQGTEITVELPIQNKIGS